MEESVQKPKKEFKMYFKYTHVRLVSLSDGRSTVLEFVDPKYSINGAIERVIEFPSFEGEFAATYIKIVKRTLEDAEKGRQLLRRAGLE